jgi:hypothetical protein
MKYSTLYQKYKKDFHIKYEEKCHNFYFESQAVNTIESLLLKLPFNLTIDQEFNFLNSLEILHTLSSHKQLNNVRKMFLFKAREEIINKYDLKKNLQKIGSFQNSNIEKLSILGVLYFQQNQDFDSETNRLLSNLLTLYIYFYLAFLENESIIF